MEATRICAAVTNPNRKKKFDTALVSHFYVSIEWAKPEDLSRSINSTIVRDQFQIPIKGAIVMNQIILGEDVERVFKYSKDMCHFLKSLPEADDMPIIVAVDYKGQNDFIQDFG